MERNEPELAEHPAKVFGVDVQPLKELVQQVGPLAQQFGRNLRDRLSGR
jgi:hypothetical protein